MKIYIEAEVFLTNLERKVLKLFSENETLDFYFKLEKVENGKDKLALILTEKK